MKRKYYFLIAIILLCILFLLNKIIWRSPPYYTSYTPQTFETKIMTMEEYSQISNFHQRPYIFQLKTTEGAILFYGSEHTKDPQNPQVIDIENYWNAFKPTVALIEGRLGFLIPFLMDPLKNFGEMGIVNSLAKRDDVQVYSWEPPRETEIKLMLHSFPAKQVALFYVLRPYFSNMRFGRPDNPDSIIEDFLNKRTQYPGLKNTLNTISDIDSMWQIDFQGYPDWHDVSDEYGLPGYLEEVSSRSNSVRDEHLANVNIDLIKKQHRVFIIAGSSHAAKLENTIRDYFSNEI